MKQNLIVLSMLFASLTSCGQKTFDEKMQSLYRNTVPLVQAKDIDRTGDILLLDVRSPEEYTVSHLDGALMIDYDNFEEADVAQFDKKAEVIVYCSVGYRSERLGEQLQEMGFENVSNLYGGIFDWKNKGLPIVNAKGQETDSVHTYNKAWSKWLYNGIKVYE